MAQFKLRHSQALGCPWACCKGMQAAKVKTAQAKPTPRGVFKGQGSPNQHTAKAKACCSQDQGTSPRACCQGQGM